MNFFFFKIRVVLQHNKKAAVESVGSRLKWPPPYFGGMGRLARNLNDKSCVFKFNHQGCQIFLGTTYHNGEKHTKSG
jgi:hypothetical protein